MKFWQDIDKELDNVKQSFITENNAKNDDFVFLFKIIIFVVLMIILLAAGFGTIATDDNNDRAYYNFSNAGVDATGRAGTLSATGTPTAVDGKSGQAYYYDGSENYDNAALTVVSAYPFTINAWVNMTEIDSGTTRNGGIVAIGAGSGFNPYYGIFVNGGLPKANARPTGAGESAATATTNITGAGWVMLTAVFASNTDRRIYVDGVNEANDTASAVFSAGVDTVAVGQNADSQSDQFFKGAVDEASIWNKTLSSAEISQLYNSGNGIFWNFANTTTPTITTNLTSGGYYNHNNISVLSTATQAVNMSVSINAGAFVGLATASTSSTNTINFTEGENNLSFKAIDEYGTSHNNFTIYIDTKNPSLNVTSYTRWNISYSFTNFANTINYSDTNFDTCLVTTDESKTFSCTNSSYTFATVGNHTFNVTVNDSANNQNTSTNNLIYINPIQQFRFNDTNNNQLITDYTFAGLSSNNDTIRIEADDFSNGVHQLNFSKTGYITTTYSVTFNDTMKLNETFAVRESQIIVNIKDRNNLSKVSGENFTLEFIGTTGFVATTTNGTRTITGLLAAGDYDLFMTSDNFTTEEIEFTFTDEEQLNLTIYTSLKNASSTGYVVIEVIDVDGQPISSATVSARQWNTATSSYISVSHGTTINDGTASLNIILDTKQYVFRATKGNSQIDSVQQVISTANNGKTITLTLAAGTGNLPSYIFNGINYNSTHVFNATTNISTVTFDWYNTNGWDVTACVNAYRLQHGNEILLTGSLNCTTSDSGTIIRNFAINTTYDTYILKTEFQQNGELYPVKVFYVYSDSSIFKQLANYQLHYFVLIFLHITSVMVGLTIRNIYIGSIGMIISSLIALAIAPTLITSTVAITMTFIGVITLLGGSKQ